MPGEVAAVLAASRRQDVPVTFRSGGTCLGPDPASGIACTIGGVVASGTILNTGAADADERLRAAEPGQYAGLERLCDRAEEAFAVKVAASAELYPHIARSGAELFGDGGYSFAGEFDYGLELLLEGLERRVADASPALRER